MPPESTTIPSLEPIAPVLPIIPVVQVTDLQLAQYADLIYRRTGIRVSPQKKTLLSNRLRRRLRDTGIKDFEEYYRLLSRLSPRDPEWDAFLQEITTHETYLFRDEAQWGWFSREFLPQIAGEARTGARNRGLRIWSAACSTGDEPITAACCIAAYLPGFQEWKIQILGTDIGAGALDQARKALFAERAMRLVPEDCRRRFFTKVKDPAVEDPGTWQARPVLTGMIAYRRHNLMQALREPPFDLVFVKNVLIYFDATSKQTVLANVRAAVCPGGLLVAGAAEGVGELLKDYVRVQSWLYQRPLR